jgi:membrane protease YdiL (CAAX protease family)
MANGDIPAPNPVPETSASLEPPKPQPSPNFLKKVFLGPNGLRALWRLLIFIAILAAARFAIVHFRHQHGNGDFSAKGILLGEALSFTIVLIATVIMGYFEKRTFADYGLPLRGAFGARFFEGLLWGFVAECATMGILYLTGNASFHGFDQRGSAALAYAAMWGGAFLMVGFFEEFLFRGYPQFTLASGIGFWPAAFLLSGLFWLAHMGNPGETWVGGLAAALAALIFCVSLRLTGNLWFAIGMHCSWDWSETYFFGVPDSGFPATGHLLNTSFSGSKWMTGGTVGPEGSVVELLVCLVVIALLYVRFAKATSASPTWTPKATAGEVA